MTDEARELRKELKEAGYNTRRVSVRRRHYSSITVTIRDTSITKAEAATIEKITKKYESIRYCEYSQEILQGGNTFVSVRYSDEVREARMWLVRPYVEAAIEKLGTESTGKLEPIGNTGYLVGRHDHLLTVWSSQKSYCINGMASTAEHVCATIISWKE